MAHADYDCCALCDCKMAYNSDAGTKDFVCAECAVVFYAETGVKVTTGEQLVKWIEDASVDVVRDLLTPGLYSRCLYPNAVDDAVRAKIDAAP